MRLHFAALALLCACTSAPPPALNPYGRAYTDDNTLKSFALTGCSPHDVDHPAVLVFGSRPLYPVGEALAGHAGSAELAFEVGADGSVRIDGAKTNNEWFETHARVAMRDWRLEPARRAGVAVAVKCRIDFNYAGG